MNSCVLMAKIVTPPELRYVQETQQPFTKMMVEFTGQQQNDQPSNLRVIAWGNLATEVQQNYHQGDMVIIVGRLSMNVIELQEGYKEKRAELSISQIYPVNGSNNSEEVATSAATQPDKIAVNGSSKTTSTPVATVELVAKTANNSTEEKNLDDIPF